MNPWLTPWWNWSPKLWNGPVTQDINPIFDCMSPQVEINFAGNRHIEQSVVSSAASYGTQLGILSKVVLELAKDQQSDAIEKLRKVSSEISDIKNAHKKTLEKSIRNELNQLNSLDAEAVQQILADYQKH